MRLAIADPPYPPIRAAHPRNDKPRASFWYGDSMPTSGQNVNRADSHPDAREWDDPSRHRQLLLDLDADYDGWAIATAHDGLPCYGDLPRGCRVMIWHKTNSMPTASRIRNVWEPVIVKPHESRRSAARSGSMPDLLVAPAPRKGFAGSKPTEWTRWVLNALGYDPAIDTVDDLFPGAGGVAMALAAPMLPTVGDAV